MELTSILGEDIVFPIEKNEALCAFLPQETVTPEAVEQNSDFQLVKSAATGCISSFEELYRRHHRKIYNLCLRMTNNKTEAEDLTQEAFIQLFRKAGSFRGESAFSTWLHRLTVNQVLMHFRRRSVKNEKVTDDGEMPEQTVNETSASGRFPILDRIDIDKAVAQLPTGYRTIFVLHDIEGFEHEEIARMLGVSIGTSKSQLHKARLKLRGILHRQK